MSYIGFLQPWRRKSKRGKRIIKIDYPPMEIEGRIHKKPKGDPWSAEYIAFFGIPYAQPPRGPLRFLPPQPLQVKTSETLRLKAHNPEYACLQYSVLRTVEGQCGAPEDCLYLNIYTPLEYRAKMPVLAFIHGGGYKPRTDDLYEIKPDALIDQPLVLVTINSRMNAAGFLNTKTDGCRGNAGLKDQVHALKWIKANIDRFGGDPNNVTISGHSAGATCVNLHLISPLSKGLFHRAIIQSGGMYTPWGFDVDRGHPKRIFPGKLGQQNELQHAIATYLRRECVQDLQNLAHFKVANGAVELKSEKLVICSGPSVEIYEEGAFLPRKVKDLMNEAKSVPVMAGMVEQEGFKYILETVFKMNSTWFLTRSKTFETFLMQNLSWSQVTTTAYKHQLLKSYEERIRAERDHQKFEDLASLISDVWFRHFYDNLNFAKPPEQLYVYKFSYLHPNSKLRINNFGAVIPKRAAIHGDEMNYLFGRPQLKSLFKGRKAALGRDALVLSNKMSSLWGNFCQFGIPSCNHESFEWLPHTKEDPRYLHIGRATEMVRGHLDGHGWKSLNEFLLGIPREDRPSTQPSTPFNFFPTDNAECQHEVSSNSYISAARG